MLKVRCPICERAMEGQTRAEWPTFPFCSPRCRLIDMGRWLDGRYGIPTSAEDAPEDGAAETEVP